MRGIKFLIFFCLLMLFAAQAQAAMFFITEPKDKLLTYNEIVYLKGWGRDLAAINVNGTYVDLAPDGSFTCGLVLRKGKNLVTVRGWDKAGKIETAKIRILRLVSFPDVDEKIKGHSHWARHEIVTLATLGILEGYPDGNYLYDRPVSRGEFATYLCRAKGLKKIYPTVDPFLDVPKEHWRAPYIQAIINKGWMKGLTKTIFGIDNGLKRSHIASIASKAEGKTILKDVKAIFYDVPKNNPLYKQIIEAKKKGLVKGISYKAPIFDPNRDMNRAEAAILFSRFGRVKYLEKWLFNFRTGYTGKVECAVNTKPVLHWVNIEPPRISLLNETNNISITALVEDRETLNNILYVKADLTPLGGPPDAVLSYKGDLKAHKGEYDLNFVTSIEVWGEKNINVTVTDKFGWEDQGLGSITVVR